MQRGRGLLAPASLFVCVDRRWRSGFGRRTL